MLDLFVYIIYKYFNLLFRLAPKFMLKFILNAMALFAYYVNVKHKKIAFLNLTLAFKTKKTKKEKYEIIKKSYKSLVYNMYEFIDNQYSSKEKILNKCNVINENYILDALKNKRKIIFVASHYGAWEQSIPYISLKYGTLGVVNRRMNNKYINDEYVKARDRNNIIMIEKKEAAKGMLKALKEGHNIAVAIDQNTPAGIDIDFFENTTKATDATSRLAVKFDALLIPVFCEINEFGNYTLIFKEPIDTKKIEGEEKIKIITQMQADIIQIQIEKKPEQWFWQHKRWKYHYSKLYDNL